ncbi:PAS domain-containing protein [Mucilaginibacter sp.]
MAISQKNNLIILTSMATMAVGITIMIGWIFPGSGVLAMLPGVVMRFNAAVCFALFGSALLVSQLHFKGCHSPLFFILSLLGVLIALLTISQELFHINTGIDQLFISDNTRLTIAFPPPGRMAFNSSLSFCFLGLGYLFFCTKNRTLHIVSQYLFHTVTLIASTALIGYIYNVSLYNSLFYVTSMVFTSGVLFLLLSMVSSLLNPDLGLAAIFTGDRVGNQVARRLCTLIFLMILIFGILKLEIKNSLLFSSTDIGMAVLVICFLLAIIALIWNTAIWLNGIDAKRKLAEEEVIKINAQLEERVEQRTREYHKSEQRYHSLIQQAIDAIYVVDNDRNFTEVNDSMCEMTGYTREELLRMNAKTLLDPEELKSRPLPLLTSYIGQGPVERTFIRKSGEKFTVELNVKVFPDNRIMVIARDVTDRNKMALEVSDAELKFRTIADKSMVGIYMVQDGKFIYVNPRFAEIFDYQPEELTNTFPLDTIIYDTHREYTNQQVKLRMEGKIDSVRYETRGKKKDGSSNWVEFYGSRAVVSGVTTIIGSMMDVTERRKAEDELKASEQKYKVLFESNPMPMWMIAKDSLKIIAANDAAASHYGYTKEELINMDVTAFRLPEDREIQLLGYEDKNDKTRVVRHVKKDGTIMVVKLTTHDIIIEGRPIRLSQTNDITEQFKAEESLKKSEANLKAILNTTDTAYGLFDKDLNALMFNAKATQFIKEQYGYNPKSNSHFSDYFPTDKFPQLHKFTNKVLIKGEDINFEVNYPQEDGSTLWYYVRLFPITSDTTEILGILMALYDITERKNAEQNLKTAYKHIQGHINSIKDMAWKQSHLIRSPLANLKGLITMLKTEPDPEILHHIRTELDRMDSIIIEMAEDAGTKN